MHLLLFLSLETVSDTYLYEDYYGFGVSDRCPLGYFVAAYIYLNDKKIIFWLPLSAVITTESDRRYSSVSRYVL